MSSILVVDDDVRLAESFAKLLQGEGYEVCTATSGEAGLGTIRERLPDVVIMDVRMPGMSGLETFGAIHAFAPGLPVIIMTAFGTTETAIEATKLGAFDYVLKPFEIPEILDLIEKALEAGRMRRTRVKLDATASESAPADALIGRSEAMQEVYKAIGRAAPTEALVLIRGESGTGKELVARAIYDHSTRAERPFVVINCVAIPDTLLESELFGYEKGAFTGAVTRRIGKIEQAHGGTLFLDEIGDMPLSIQAKILRLLQEKSIERLGGGEPIPVDVRIIAATNRDLEAGIESGRFREDLYYRLRVVSINLPPLRARRGDIAVLCDYFMVRLSREMGMENPGLTAEALAAVEKHEWPGNVRELANTLQKALIFSRGYPIRPEGIWQAVQNGAAERSPELESNKTESFLRQWIRKSLARGRTSDPFAYCIDNVTRILIAEALEVTRGNRSQAARLLGLSRPTLLTKMKKFGLAGGSGAGHDEEH